MADYSYMILPSVACLILTGIHAYLGIHVLERRVIFVDLALAQIAALGYTVALWLGHDPKTTEGYACSLVFTIFGAGLFALSRMRRTRQYQEAVIGVIYVGAGAAAMLVMDKLPHGAEHIQELLEGNIVWVTVPEVAKMAGVYAAVAAIHVVFRKPLFQITYDPDGAARDGLRIRLWDFLFYATFGFVVTSSVQVAGVLLVFTYLIVPGLITAFFIGDFRARLAAGWAISWIISLIGLFLSYDRPTGPTIIVLQGLALAAAIGLRRFHLNR